jgi:hypothetical protein
MQGSTPPPPATAPPDVTSSIETSKNQITTAVTSGMTVFGGLYGIIIAVGAAYLSYRTYGSAMWAVLAFFFPYLYFPYYAFFATIPQPQQSIIGGKRKFLKMFNMKF